MDISTRTVGYEVWGQLAKPTLMIQYGPQEEEHITMRREDLVRLHAALTDYFLSTHEEAWADDKCWELIETPFIATPLDYKPGDAPLIGSRFYRFARYDWALLCRGGDLPADRYFLQGDPPPGSTGANLAEILPVANMLQVDPVVITEADALSADEKQMLDQAAELVAQRRAADLDDALERLCDIRRKGAKPPAQPTPETNALVDDYVENQWYDLHKLQGVLTIHPAQFNDLKCLVGACSTVSAINTKDVDDIVVWQMDGAKTCKDAINAVLVAMLEQLPKGIVHCDVPRVMLRRQAFMLEVLGRLDYIV